MTFRNTLIASTALVLCLAARPVAADERAAEFPALADGRKIITVDLHTHSVFSDGRVWPSIRVEEAHRDGLDVLAVTEHLEYQRHGKDIANPDRNRSYEVAVEEAQKAGIEDVIIINGAEITRNMPPGHVNAVFVTDANALLTEDFDVAINAARNQGAFVFWNHPNWLPQSPDGVARLTPLHRRLIREGKLHGVEVANGTLDAYSEHAFAIALENNLTVLGTSDIHGLVDWTHDAGHGGHRPMTLALAAGKSADAVKTALFDGATVAWNYDDLIGRKENVEAVVRACIVLEPGPWRPRSSILAVDLVNACPLPFTLRNRSKTSLHNTGDLVRVERNGRYTMEVRMGEGDRVDLDLEVLNTQVRPREPLALRLSAAAPSRPADPR